MAYVVNFEGKDISVMGTIICNRSLEGILVEVHLWGGSLINVIFIVKKTLKTQGLRYFRSAAFSL